MEELKGKRLWRASLPGRKQRDKFGIDQGQTEIDERSAVQQRPQIRRFQLGQDVERHGALVLVDIYQKK